MLDHRVITACMVTIKERKRLMRSGFFVDALTQGTVTVCDGSLSFEGERGQF